MLVETLYNTFNFYTISLDHIITKTKNVIPGETALHLAARNARADAAKRLLDAGADPNAQDNTGRTPLHAAVAADAIGVFQILLRNRSTNLNARMHDGTTPLILAARLAIEGMVEKLIESDADLNAADEYGRFIVCMFVCLGQIAFHTYYGTSDKP